MKQEMHDLFKLVTNVAFYSLAAYIIFSSIRKAKSSGKIRGKKSDKTSDKED